MRDLQALFRVTGGARRFMLLTILRSPFDALYTALPAVFLQLGFRAVTTGSEPLLMAACALLGVGSLLLFLYNGTVWAVYAAFVIRWVGTLRRKLFEHIASLSLSQIEAQPAAYWITRLNADMQAAAALLNQPLHLPHAACATVNILVSSAILLLMSPALFGIVAAFTLPHLLVSRLVIARPMTAYAAKAQEITAENTADLSAIITCADTALLYDAQAFLRGRFERSSRKLRKANMRLWRRGALGAGLLTLVGLGGYLVALLVGGGWIADGNMTFSSLTAIFQYRGGVIKGAAMLAASLMNIRAALAGTKRVNETMRLPMEE